MCPQSDCRRRAEKAYAKRREKLRGTFPKKELATHNLGVKGWICRGWAPACLAPRAYERRAPATC